MMFPRDQIPYSAIVDRPALRLPKSARVVVWTIVNVEEWDIQGPMPRTVLPPPSGAQVIPDVPNFAWFEYGMRVGFWRLKSVLDKHKIKATLAEIYDSSAANGPFSPDAESAGKRALRSAILDLLVGTGEPAEVAERVTAILAASLVSSAIGAP